MTTLAADQGRSYELGDVSDYPMIASDIIFEGAAVGLVAGTGHARPLAQTDVFAGFALSKKDNSSGSAADVNVHVQKRGAISLPVTGAVITDVGQPVYAQDDNAFSFNPVAGVFVGYVSRFVSAGVVIVGFDTESYSDPYESLGSDYETKSAGYTIDVQDNGKVIFVDTTAAITLPAVATGVSVTLVNIGPFGTVEISVDPAAADLIHAPDIGGTDNKDHINTAATARRGDYVRLVGGLVATGYVVTDQRGIWAQEA